MVNRGFSFTIWIIFLLLLGSLSIGAADVEITCSPAELTAFQGEKINLSLEVKNNLIESLRPDKNYFLSYHIYDTQMKLLQFENPRFRLPKVLRRKKTSTFKLPIFFNYKKGGTYIVELDLVKEGEFWGSQKKWETAKVKVYLKSLFSAEFSNKYQPIFCQTNNPLINREQYLLRITLKNNEIKKNNKIFGFAAGSNYPALWIRDIATFISYALDQYSFDTLANSVEGFLEHQREDGQIVDWIDTSGNTDKNTVQTDQESSLVLAAYELWQRNPQWIYKKIKGKKIIDGLESALGWVWKTKRDKKWNLIYSGFTADWGDVENTFPDERASKLSKKSILAFSVYTQSKFIQAVDRMIEMLGSRMAKDNKKRISTWRKASQILKSQTHKHLYLKEKGYFISHIVPATDQYLEMEKEMLAVGGNAEAIIAGLLNKNQIAKFLSELNRRREKYKLKTVSFTLIPPYPAGFFSYHLLAHPWSYQNGGEWDWIGGRVVKALFLYGFVEEAKKYLIEIIRKNLDNLCIYEWEGLHGRGITSALFYTGAAGVIGEAIRLGYGKK
jgi:hypothetical protein